MKYTELREELKAFYWSGDEERAKAFAEKCFSVLDKKVTDAMTVTELKLLQYDVICDLFEPILFKHNPFYCETGVLSSLSDGARWAKGYGFTQANGWAYQQKAHLFWEQDEDFIATKQAQIHERFYLICGPFNDVSQHFNFNNRPILEGGLKGIYEKAKAELKNAENAEQTEFLNAVCHGMLSLKKMAEKFSQKAYEMLETEKEDACRANLLRIAETASRVPWEKPETFYEALCVLAFMRVALGSLEGVGPNTFGRVDVDLYPFYKSDVEKGILTYEEAHALVAKFLIMWDMHYDHDMLMAGYADHELENTYTLGGCDAKGEPLYNEVTKMFLSATREEDIIFPKIKCRYSSVSPKEYLDEINLSVIQGTSTILYQNDEASIASILRGGRTLEEARDYFVSGCWGFATNQEKFDHGNYVNMLRPFEYALHNKQEDMERVGMHFELFDECKTFEEVYATALKNCEILARERVKVRQIGGGVYPQVERLPIFSSTLEGCLESRTDHTMQGGKYNDEYHLLVGLPNIVDSLLAIKTLVFDQKKYTLKEMLEAVRNNWQDEAMRLDAIRCPGWGDGSEISCTLANRFNNDLFKMYERIHQSTGLRVHMGHLTYTEIRFWAESLLATPDGRRNGEYFSQGLTPSRLKKIPCVTDVINSLACLDKSTLGANSVVNIILPSTRMTLDVCEAFLRAAAKSAMQSLQLNCVTKEQLLDAQKHPENYKNLVVRVCGFSAKFTSLSKEWQAEVLSRNFYE